MELLGTLANSSIYQSVPYIQGWGYFACGGGGGGDRGFCIHFAGGGIIRQCVLGFWGLEVGWGWGRVGVGEGHIHFVYTFFGCCHI